MATPRSETASGVCLSLLRRDQRRVVFRPSGHLSLDLFLQGDPRRLPPFARIKDLLSNPVIVRESGLAHVVVVGPPIHDSPEIVWTDRADGICAVRARRPDGRVVSDAIHWLDEDPNLFMDIQGRCWKVPRSSKCEMDRVPAPWIETCLKSSL